MLLSDVTDCASDCLNCADNGDDNCDPGQCDIGFWYNSTDMQCEGKTRNNTSTKTTQIFQISCLK